MAKKLVPTHAVKTVTAAGTQERLSATPFKVKNVSIQALKGNTNKVYIGDSSVSASSYGCYLTAGNSISIEAPPIAGGESEDIDLYEIWIDADTNSEGVALLYLKSDS